MHVVVPYSDAAGPSPETTDALHRAHEGFVCAYVGDDDYAYQRLLRELWAKGEAFAIVEQDIVVEPSTLQTFRACPKLVCCATYPYLKSERYAGLGCVRFSTQLLRAAPDVMERVAEYSDAQHPAGHWCATDAWLQRELVKRRVGRCVAPHGNVGHLHRNPSHQCVPDEYLWHEEAAA
jgi:hypothetical protein